MAYIGTSPANGVRRKHTYTATAGQTSFSGADDNNVTLTYVDTEYLDVYQNGVKLVAVSDYASTTGTSVVLVQGASVDDTVEIIVFDVFSVADTVSAGSGGNFAGNVGMGGTLNVTGDSTFSNIAGGVVFNEASADVDFRVESDNLTHALFVQGSDGNVGIGTSSPATFGKLSLTVDGTTTPTTADNVKNSSVNLFAETNGDSVNNTVGIFGWQSNAPGIGSGIGFSRENASNWGSQIRFYTHPTTTSNISDITERMRIDSTGSLLINNTGASPLNSGRVRIYNDTAQDAIKTYQATAGTTCLWNRINATSSYFAVFNYNGSGVGTITTNGSATAYNTSSDYRLKENVITDWDATTRLKQLKPSRFNFIADADTTVDGFLAHEVSSIVPEAISGTKDAVEVWKDGEELPNDVSVGDNKLDADGNTIPVMQGIDQSKLVPLLVKTIQELEARITALENA